MPGNYMIKFLSYRALLLAGFIFFISLNSAGAQTANPIFTQAERIELQNIIQNYLRKNPEVIVRSIEDFRERERQDQQNQARLTLKLLEKQVLNDPDSPIAGNPDGDVTVVEFFDYLCTYCKRIIPMVQKLLKQDKNLRYVFKELPILSPESRLAARAALVVWKNQKERYFDFHTELMAAQGRLSEARILRFAKRVGADTNLIKRKIRSVEISAMLQRNFDLARRLGVKGTPAFIIGDTIVPGVINLNDLKSLIMEARKKG